MIGSLSQNWNIINNKHSVIWFWMRTGSCRDFRFLNRKKIKFAGSYLCRICRRRSCPIFMPLCAHCGWTETPSANDVKNPVYTRKLSKECLVKTVAGAGCKRCGKNQRSGRKHQACSAWTLLFPFPAENTCLGVSKKLSQEESKRLSALLENTCKDHEAEGYGLVIQNQCRGGSGNRIMRRYRAGAERIRGFKEDRYT